MRGQSKIQDRFVSPALSAGSCNSSDEQASGSPDEEGRGRLRRSIVAGLGALLGPAEDSTPPVGTPTSVGEPEREQLRRAFAVLLRSTVDDITDARLDVLLAEVRRSAEASADYVGRWANSFIEHLERIGCRAADVSDYLRLARRTLASLYFAVSDANPSPTEVKRLALRYALDARKPIHGRTERFQLRRCENYWEIREYGSPAMAMAAIPMPPTIVRDPFAVFVVDRVFADPPETYRLREFIEGFFSGRPSKTDALPLTHLGEFKYQLHTTDGGQPTVALWIGPSRVKLPKRRDVHKLLEYLCQQPDSSLNGPQARAELDISNASEACRLIRAALHAARPGSGDWLMTNPIHWAPGKTPRLRSRGSGDSE